MVDGSFAPDFSTAAALLAAHGSPNSAGGPCGTRKNAEILANLERFGAVRAGFLAEKPFVADVLRTMIAAHVYVVPNMATNGFITLEKLPHALNLTGPVTERIGPQGRQQIILTEAVGTHALIPQILADTVHGALQTLNIDQKDTALVVVGHGSTKSRANADQTKKVAHTLPKYGLTLPIVTAFLEEDPKILDWRKQEAVQTAKTVLFVPFLIADGFHATLDIPLAIGFDPGDTAFICARSEGRPAQIDQDQQNLVYLPPLGDSPRMTDVIIARIKQAHATWL